MGEIDMRLPIKYELLPLKNTKLGHVSKAGLGRRREMAVRTRRRDLSGRSRLDGGGRR